MEEFFRPNFVDIFFIWCKEAARWHFFIAVSVIRVSTRQSVEFTPFSTAVNNDFVYPQLGFFLPLHKYFAASVALAHVTFPHLSTVWLFLCVRCSFHYENVLTLITSKWEILQFCWEIFSPIADFFFFHFPHGFDIAFLPRSGQICGLLFYPYFFFFIIFYFSCYYYLWLLAWVTWFFRLFFASKKKIKSAACV